MTRLKLSICICTYNRLEFLNTCVDSVLKQINGLEEVELIIINNNSTDETESYCQNLALDNKNIRCFLEKNQGLSHARNRAKKEYHGEWLAFLDDDAYASSDWVNNILNVIENNNFDIFGGPYDPWYKDGKESWYKDIYGSNRMWLPFNKTTRLLDKSVSGGNMIINRNVLEKLSFDIDKGMNGYNRSYGEETYFQSKAKDLGFKVYFVPDILIFHFVPKSKQCIEYFIERATIQGNERVNNKDIDASYFMLFKIVLKSTYSILSKNFSNLLKFIKGEVGTYNMYIDNLVLITYYKNFFSSVINKLK